MIRIIIHPFVVWLKSIEKISNKSIPEVPRIIEAIISAKNMRKSTVADFRYLNMSNSYFPLIVPNPGNFLSMITNC